MQNPLQCMIISEMIDTTTIFSHNLPHRWYFLKSIQRCSIENYLTSQFTSMNSYITSSSCYQSSNIHQFTSYITHHHILSSLFTPIINSSPEFQNFSHYVLLQIDEEQKETKILVGNVFISFGRTARLGCKVKDIDVKHLGLLSFNGDCRERERQRFACTMR